MGPSLIWVQFLITITDKGYLVFLQLYCGPKSDLGQVILKLRQLFDGVKLEMASQLDEVLGPHTTRAYMDTELVRLEQASLKGWRI